ncbi:MAG: DMT family transporter [Rhodobacteraceae bacterium]|nr:DMT family transporter [Paracoccaceae bacterium]
MNEKRTVDGFGATAMIGFAALLAINQVVVKVTGGGFSPVFQVALRSAGGIIFLLFWLRFRQIPMSLPQGTLIWGILSGLLFSFEFICLYISLDLTTVSRASIIFYSMPVWLALASHFVLPGEKLNAQRFLGLILALGGVAFAVLDQSSGKESLTGDFLALVAAVVWAAIILMLRLTPLQKVRAEMQLFLQISVSAVILLPIAPLFGDLLRNVQPVHVMGMLFQVICVVGLGYLGWFWLMKVYRANTVASFSFLSPVLAVLLGWLLLDEQIGTQIWVALMLVAAGIFLINRR